MESKEGKQDTWNNWEEIAYRILWRISKAEVTAKFETIERQLYRFSLALMCMVHTGYVLE